MTRTGVRVGVALATIALSAGFAVAQDWEQWRGPNGDGISNESDWTPAALKNEASVSWRAEVGMGHSAVVVRDGRPYTMGSRPVPSRGDDAWEDVVLISGSWDLFAVEVATGKVSWIEPWDTYADPVLVGDRILLTAGRDGGNKGTKLLRLNNGRPELIWHNDRTNYSFQSWVALDDHGYGITRGRRGATLECINLADGQIKWSTNE